MSRQISRIISAQASVLLVYSIFLFLIGLTLVSLGVALRLIYAIQLHVYCYPDWTGCLTLLPFLLGILYFIFKGKCLTILLSITSLLSFLGAVAYIGILLVETHLYDLIRYKINEFKAIENQDGLSLLTTTTTSSTPFGQTSKLMQKQNQFVDHSVLLYKFNKTSAASLDAAYNDKWFYVIIFLIFGLSLLQALLSVIGMTLSFVWSPCCQTTYTPLRNHHLIETSTNGRKGLRINGIDFDNNGDTCLLKMKHFDDV